MRIKPFFCVFLFLSVGFQSKAQVVWENPKAEVYPFLQRQAQKGNILLNDVIQPISRKQIAEHLQELSLLKSELNPTERKELEFFLQEYAEFTPDLSTDSITFLKKDPAGRLRFLSVKKGDFLLKGDPIIQSFHLRADQKKVSGWANGLSFWGHAGKNFSFQASFRDITETGTNIDSLRQFTPQTGIVRTIVEKGNTVNYTDLTGYITYNWNNGSISVGKDQQIYGYGQGGNLILSDKAPSYPFIRLDYQPLNWLKFHYSHAWLHSNTIDSARTYQTGNTVYGGFHQVYINKFLASHSFIFYPAKGLSISLGESMIYSDNLKVGYLIPIMFFKALDHYSSRYNIVTGENGQFFLQASSRNHIKNTHLYAALFIDEIRTEAMFNREKSRNQLGFQVGASVTDLLIPYFTAGLEYTRINPFVYQNLNPVQNYTSQDYVLGDWIGQNADRVTAFVKYNPLPRLTTRLQWDYIRKGPNHSAEDQYFAQPQPKFLIGPVEKQKQWLLEVRYELMHKLHLSGAYFKQDGIIRPALQTAAVPQEFRFGISYGL
ncbi:MAG TPA: hypothetical protein VEV16_12890 [Daejeonella sp.]|nr:hypothetical protein [Daejeonella sp.]